jgi:hypothetical protein
MNVLKCFLLLLQGVGSLIPPRRRVILTLIFFIEQIKLDLNIMKVKTVITQS